MMYNTIIIIILRYGGGNGSNAIMASIRCMHMKYMDIPFGKFGWIYESELVFSNMGLIGRFMPKAKSEQIHCDSLGFECFPLSGRGNGWERVQVPVIHDKSHKNAWKAVNENIAYYKRIAKVCRNNNVKLIFITIPWYKTALETVTGEGKKEMYAIVDTIKTVNPDITYLDLLCDKNFNEDDFCNATHLGAEGAKKLSNILVSYCQ